MTAPGLCDRPQGSAREVLRRQPAVPGEARVIGVASDSASAPPLCLLDTVIILGNTSCTYAPATTDRAAAATTSLAGRVYELAVGEVTFGFDAKIKLRNA